MGATTPKGLRYPEPSTEARVMPARIQDLANDINDVLTTHDARFTALDTKTNTTNTTLNSRGTVVSRYGNSAGVYTHSPNDGVIRTVNQHTDQFYIPANAKYAYVCIGNTAWCSLNAACHWQALVSFQTGGGAWQNVDNGDLVSHNQGNGALDMGFFVSGFFDVTANRNNYGSVAINNTNDTGSGGWVINGYMHWSVTCLA